MSRLLYFDRHAAPDRIFHCTSFSRLANGRRLEACFRLNSSGVPC